MGVSDLHQREMGCQLYPCPCTTRRDMGVGIRYHTRKKQRNGEEDKLTSLCFVILAASAAANRSILGKKTWYTWLRSGILSTTGDMKSDTAPPTPYAPHVRAYSFSFSGSDRCPKAPLMAVRTFRMLRSGSRSSSSAGVPTRPDSWKSAYLAS